MVMQLWLAHAGEGEAAAPKRQRTQSMGTAAMHTVASLGAARSLQARLSLHCAGTRQVGSRLLDSDVQDGTCSSVSILSAAGSAFIHLWQHRTFKVHSAEGVLSLAGGC